MFDEREFLERARLDRANSRNLGAGGMGDSVP